MAKKKTIAFLESFEIFRETNGLFKVCSATRLQGSAVYSHFEIMSEIFT